MLSLERLLHRSTLTAAALLLVIGSSASATDLTEVYERAKTFDATLQAARHDYDAARQQLPLARSALLPQLGAGADAAYTTAETDLGDDDYSSTALSVTLNQTLFNLPNFRLVDQAELSVMQADAEYLAVEQELIRRVATAYFNVLRAQAIVEFSQSELQAIGRQREQAERRFDVGLVPVTDVRTAQAQYDLAVAQEIDASNQLATAQEALLVISGLEVELLAPLAEDFQLSRPDPADEDSWVERSSEQNLDLLIARLQNRNARTQVDVERAARYPTLEAVGVASRLDTGQQDRPDTTSGEVRLELRLPLLTGGRIKAQVAQANARALSASEQLVARERAAIQQTRDAYRGVNASISRAGALRQALSSTEASADATEAGFRAGTRTSVEVLQALRDVYRARSDYVSARYDYIINTLDLKAAAGTLEEEDLFAINRFLQPIR